jgi:hypothetical protein
MLLSTLTFATDSTKPSEQLQKEFNREFAQSTDVEWTQVGDFYKASFLLEGKYLTVYFDAFNNIESISRNISTDALPMILQKNLKKGLLETGWISDCFELYGQNGTEYYIVVENADEIIFYQANQNDWEVFKRTEK